MSSDYKRNPTYNLPPLRPIQPYPYPMHYPMQLPEKPDDHPNKRKRTSRACDVCRRKKIKCELIGLADKCKYCQSAHYECTFNHTAKKRGPPKGYIEVLETRLKKMETMLDELAHKKTDSISPPEKGYASSDTRPPGAERVTRRDSEDGAFDKDPTENMITLKEDNGQEYTIPIELLSIASEGSMRYICELSSLPTILRKIDVNNDRLGRRFKRLGDSIFEYEFSPNISKQQLLQRLGTLNPGESIKGINDWIYRATGVDKMTRKESRYFAYIHPVLPVLNKILFLKQYRGEINQYPAAPLLNSIFGAAVRYIETCKSFGDEIPYCSHIELKKGWSEQLFDNVITLLKDRYCPSISTIQAIAIANNNRTSWDEKIVSSWLLNCVAVRMAQHVGLHRLSDRWPIPESEKEARKRIWWSTYILDIWSAAATGKPQTILDDDCDESYPKDLASQEEVMDDHDQTIPTFPSLDKNIAKKVKGEGIPLYQPFVQIAKLSEILGKILQGLYTPLAKKQSQEHGSDAIVTYLDRALSEWRAALPPSLQFSNSTHRPNAQGNAPLMSMSAIIHLTYYTLLILLHRPFIENDEGNRSSQSSLNICTNAATCCIEVAEKMHYRDFLLVSWNFAIYPVFTASLIHIYNATNKDRDIAEAAKSNLAKAICVVERLSKVSFNASKFHALLLELAKARGIDIQQDKHATKPDRKRKKKGQREAFDQEPVNHHLALCSSPAETSSNPGSTIAMLSDTEGCIPSSQSCSSADDWINGLHYNQQQQHQQQTAAPNLLLETDPFSLRQFNLPQYEQITMNELPISNGSSSNHNDMMQYQQPMHSMSFNAADSLLLGSPLPIMNDTQYNPVMSTQHYQQSPMTTFRNRPDNPFWAVPSSMELDEWMAYLLPDQSMNRQ
ncbi:hypothetical protein G6F70_000558 [Rhizopus microsporus]|nr:hypothetical protein G6F71_000094 [Rhizopus microsporus]KAG1204341.1 hypothetical protein G6F70_000558 [Rhizopus microsporus]KAG1215791.1 hypothetical protein G6F69_000690 [Rhizopus microsporus]KAG1238323.1 hypothetical protein G6F67_000516 [Rhizopus microsporus]KAG1268649.1 hypothetical protein G6F68_000955 [Rhizopus microsporus]